MQEPKTTYGLMVHRVTYYGNERLDVQVMRRDDDADWPLNVGAWYSLEKKPYLCDLHMIGRVYESNPEFYTDKPEFTDVSHVGLVEATAMVKTLTAVYNRIQKDEAREPGDMFLAFARAIGAQWVVVPRKERLERSNLTENKYAWYGLADGRNAYRGLIQQMVSEEKARQDEIKKYRAA